MVNLFLEKYNCTVLELKNLKTCVHKNLKENEVVKMANGLPMNSPKEFPTALQACECL